MIDISNIVNVDLKIVKEQSIIGAYRTVVYFISKTMQINDEPAKAVLCSNQDDVDAITFIDDSINEIKYNTKQFFINGGSQLLLITASGYTIEDFKSDIEYVRTITNDFIYVTINNSICDVSEAINGYTSSVILDIAKWFEHLKSPQTLRLLLTKNIKTLESEYNYDYINNFSNYSVGIKFCTKSYNGKIIDAALLIGAYFSKINLNNSESIKDYCYTPEEILKEEVIRDDDTDVSYTETTNIASEDTTQSVFTNLNVRNYNFIDTIGTKIINFGGNLSNGVSISTDFATICAENDICTATLNTILGKQYLNEGGLTNLVSAIHKQLQRYIDNGYLRNNTYYSGEDLNINYNNKSYLVLKKGAVLINGYYVFAIPVSDISLVDKEEKRFPPIYVVIESLSGARTVVIQGEVR